MKTRADIRRELDALAQDVARAGVGAVPMVVEVQHTDLDEHGDVGAYLRRKYPKGFPSGSHTPLVIVLGPDHVEPPPEYTPTV